MQKYFLELCNYWQYKVLAGLWATFWSDDLPQLFLLFLLLEILDIFTAWLRLSRQCYVAIYPNSPGNLWIYVKFIWQARKWRYIKSAGLRDGFCDKMLTYLLLLLVAATVDAALAIGHSPRVFLTVTVSVLATTEALSIFENLSDAGVAIVSTIREKIKEKLK